MKRLLRWIRGPSREKLEEIFEYLVREGYLELIGYEFGEEIYRTTEKGRKFLAEYKRGRHHSSTKKPMEKHHKIDARGGRRP